MTARTAGPAAARGRRAPRVGLAPFASPRASLWGSPPLPLSRAIPGRRVTRGALVVIGLLLIGCTTPTVLVPSPTPTASATATASPAISPTASPRALRPFTGVVPMAVPADRSVVAVDRGRLVYVTASRELAVLDAGSTQPRIVRTPEAGFFIDVDPHGLRGDTLVFAEERTDGQRTDRRIVRVDLATNTATTLDDHSGPFLGSGDTWRPRAPVTNGTDVAWIRVDHEATPFGIHIVLARGSSQPRVLYSGTSAVWMDLDEQGRVAKSVLITEGEVAQLEVWHDGSVTPLGTRPSGAGGAAWFAGGGVFWQRGAGMRPAEAGDLIALEGRVQPIQFPGCVSIGSGGRYLLLSCDTPVLMDPANGERHPLPGMEPRAGARAVAWREGAQWWLGTIAP